MARYFLDTGVLVGYTFLHDMWRAEAEEVFDPDNSLYIDQVVLFEYCNNSSGNSVREADIDWETEQGKFGRKIRFAEGIEPIVDMALESYDEDELTVEAVIDEFISAADIDEEIEEEKREKYIRPTLKEFILDELDGESLTHDNLSELTTALFATIIDGGRKKREELKNRVTCCYVSEEERSPYVSRLVETMIRDDYNDRESALEEQRREGSPESTVEGKGKIRDRDTLILADLAYLDRKGVVGRIITNDKGHIYSRQERINAAIGVDVQHIKDSVADYSLP